MLKYKITQKELSESFLNKNILYLSMGLKKMMQYNV